MDFSRWLTTWLKQHPLKESKGVDRAAYTREVISRIQERHAPTPNLELLPARNSWVLGWRLLLNPAFALAAAVVVVLTVTSAIERSRTQLAQQALHDAARLAESPPSDDQWIQQTMQLLEQLDQDAPSDDAAGSASNSDEEWLKELETLDEQDLNSSSS